MNKDILENINDYLGQGIQEFRWVDFDTGQLEIQPRPPLVFPCCLVDIAYPKCDDKEDKDQLVNANITLRIAYEPQGNTHNNSPVRTSALKYVDTVEKVHTLLQGWHNSGAFSTLSRTSAYREKRRDGLVVYRIVYKTTFVDSPDNVIETFNVNLTVGNNGTVITNPDQLTNIEKGSEVLFCAQGNIGYKFNRWLINGTERLERLTKIFVNATVDVIAEFIQKITKTLTISISGTGTTNPIPGTYEDSEAGTVLPIEATSTNDDYYFDHFNVNGNQTTANPVNVTVDENSSVVAYFFSFILWLFTQAPVKVGTDWVFYDPSPSAYHAKIKGTRIGTFNGTVYMQLPAGFLNGVTITDSNGTYVPAIAGDTITCTAGSAFDISLSNGYKANFINGQGDEIYFYNNGNVVIASLENVVLSKFWANTSAEAEPVDNSLGYNKDLVCETSGITAHLAHPDKSNLGVEKVENGGFDTDSNWVYPLSQGISISEGKLKYLNTPDSANNVYQLNVTELDKIYKVSWEITDYVLGAMRIQLFSNVTPIVSSNGKYTYFIKAATLTRLEIKLIGGGINTFNVDNILVKEVTAIDLTTQNNVWEFLIKPTGIQDIYFINSTKSITGDGYMLRVTPTYITLFKNDAGALTQLSTQSMTINAWDKITIYSDGLIVKVNDIQKLSSSDTTYTETLLTVLDFDVSDIISNFTFNGIRYDVSNFITQTGAYGVRKVIGIGGGVDALGRELETAANEGFTANDNTLLFPNTPELTDFLPAELFEGSGATYEQLKALVTTGDYEVTKITNAITKLKML